MNLKEFLAKAIPQRNKRRELDPGIRIENGTVLLPQEPTSYWILERIIQYLDIHSLVRLLDMKEFNVLPNITELRIKYPEILNGVTFHQKLERVNTIQIRDYHSFRSDKTILPSIYPFVQLFQNLVVLDVNYCTFINDETMEKIVVYNRNFVSLCFMACPKITMRTLEAIVATQRRLLLVAFSIPMVRFDLLISLLSKNPAISQFRSPNYAYEDYNLEMFIQNTYPLVRYYQFILPYEEALKQATMEEQFMNQKPHLLTAPVANAVSYKSMDGRMELNEVPSLRRWSQIRNNATIWTILILERDYDTYKKMLCKYTPHSQLHYFLLALEADTEKLLDDLYIFLDIIFEVEGLLGYAQKHIDFSTEISTDYDTKMYVEKRPTGRTPNHIDTVTFGEICVQSRGCLERMALNGIDFQKSKTREWVSTQFLYFTQTGKCTGNPSKVFVKNLFSSNQTIEIVKAIKDLWSINRDSSVWTQKDENENTLLHNWVGSSFQFDYINCAHQLGTIMRYFADCNIFVHTPNTLGESPLQIATQKGNDAIIRRILSDAIAMNNSKFLPSTSEERKMLVRDLVSGTQIHRGVQILLTLWNQNSGETFWGEKDSDGNSILHLWSKETFDMDFKKYEGMLCKFVNNLASHHIRPNTPNLAGETPYKIAYDLKNYAVMKLFRKATGLAEIDLLVPKTYDGLLTFLQNIVKSTQTLREIELLTELWKRKSQRRIWKNLDSDGNSFLHLWAKADFDLDPKKYSFELEKFVKQFSDEDIDPNTANNLGKTAGHIAIEGENQMLISLFAKTCKKRTFLQYPTTMKYLIKVCEKKDIEVMVHLFRQYDEKYERTKQFAFTNGSIVTSKVKDSIEESSLVFGLLDFPKYLGWYLKDHPESLNKAKIVINKKREGLVEYSLLDFCLGYFLPDSLIQIVLTYVSESTLYDYGVLYKWLEVKLNLFLKAIPGLESFLKADLVNNVYDQTNVASAFPVLNANEVAQIDSFSSTLDFVPTSWLLKKSEEGIPIPFYLFHLFLMNDGIKRPPPVHLTRILERCNSDLKDLLGNTVLHVLARFSPNSLFLTALGNKKIDLNSTNLAGETPIIVFVKSVSLESPNIESVFQKMESQRSFQLNPNQLVSMKDWRGRNIFVNAMFRDIVRSHNATESTLLKNVFKWLPYLDEAGKGELAHSILEQFPMIEIPDAVGLDQLEEVDQQIWYWLFERLVKNELPLNATLNNVTPLDILIAKARVEVRWNNLIENLRQFGLKASKEVNPQSLIESQVYSTNVHQICMNPDNTLIGFLKSKPEIIYFCDAYNRLPVHLFAQNCKVRDESCAAMLEATLGSTNNIVLLPDKLHTTPLMYSIMGDCCFGYSSTDSVITRTLIEKCPDHVVPESDDQRNAAFLLLNITTGFSRNLFDPSAGTMELLPSTIIDIVSRWKTCCNLDIDHMDENGETLCDYWNSVMDERGFSLAISAVLRKGLKDLKARTAEEIFADNHHLPPEILEESVNNPVIEFDLQRGLFAEDDDELLPPMHVRLAIPEPPKKPAIVPQNSNVLKEGIINVSATNFVAKTLAEAKEEENKSTLKRTHSESIELIENFSSTLFPKRAKTSPEDEISNQTLQSDAFYEEEEEVEGGEAISVQPITILEAPTEVVRVQPSVPQAIPEESESDDDIVVLGQEDVSTAETVVEETCEELTTRLFTQCKKGNTIMILGLLTVHCVSPYVRNEDDQYPIHCWLLSLLSSEVVSKNQATIVKELLNTYPDRIVNHLDVFLASPLSLAILYDVLNFANSIQLRKSESGMEHRVLPRYNHIAVLQSPITETLLSNNATLQNTTRNGSTPWHGLASVVFPKENRNYPGFTESTHHYTFLLLVCNFKKIGNIDLNAKDGNGRTGFDIFCERFTNQSLNLVQNDFERLGKELYSIGCRPSRELQ